MKAALLSLALVLTVIAPVRADEVKLTEEQMAYFVQIATCARALYEYDMLKIETRNDIYRDFLGSRGFGRDTAILYAQYRIATAFIDTQNKCGGDYNMRQMAYTTWEQGYRSIPYIDDRLGIR
jgi:hypothetical protein